MPTDLFSHDAYLIRRKVFKLFGAAFHIYDFEDNLLLYSSQKAFKLKEDIRLFTGEDQSEEVLKLSARQVIDFGATYDIVDSTTNQTLGALRRKGIKSMLRDQWLILDGDGREVGLITEDSTTKAVVRRVIEMAAALMPQQYHVETDGRTVATFSQNFNPFVKKITADFTRDSDYKLDRRIGVAAAVLLAAIEGRQG